MGVATISLLPNVRALLIEGETLDIVDALQIMGDFLNANYSEVTYLTSEWSYDAHDDHMELTVYYELSPPDQRVVREPDEPDDNVELRFS